MTRCLHELVCCYNTWHHFIKCYVMWRIQLQSWCQRLASVTELPHVQSTWGPVSGVWLKCTMLGRNEDKQQAKPQSSLTNFHLSPWTSVFPDVIIHSPAPPSTHHLTITLFLHTHAYTVTTAGVQTHLSVCLSLILWEWNQMEAVRCFNTRVRETGGTRLGTRLGPRSYQKVVQIY